MCIRDRAYTDATRIGSTYTVSGSNIKVATDAHFGKMTAGTATAAATLDVGSVWLVIEPCVKLGTTGTALAAPAPPLSSSNTVSMRLMAT